MTIAAFNTCVASNGGLGNLLSVRAIGEGLIYLFGSYNKEVALERESNLVFTIKDDCMYVYALVSTPQGPQTQSVRVIDMRAIYDLTFFYVPEVHDVGNDPEIMNIWPEHIREIITEKIVYINNITPPLPEASTVVKQTAVVTSFVNAINSGNYNHARALLDQDFIGYAHADIPYLRDVAFAGSPTKQLTDVHVYSSFAVATFGDGVVLIGLSAKFGTFYIKSISREP